MKHILWWTSVGLIHTYNNINGELWLFEASGFIIWGISLTYVCPLTSWGRGLQPFYGKGPYTLLFAGLWAARGQRTISGVPVASSCEIFKFFTRFTNVIAGRIIKPGELRAARGLSGGNPCHTPLCVSGGSLLCFQWPTEYVYRTECVAAERSKAWARGRSYTKLRVRIPTGLLMFVCLL